MSARTRAEEVLAKVADAELLAQVRLIADNDAEYVWTWDADVPYVAGLVRRSSPGTALCVVYVADLDFEENEDRLAEAEAATRQAPTPQHHYSPPAPSTNHTPKRTR